VRQAFSDAAHDYHHDRHMDAAAWLELAGLVDPDGTMRYGMPSGAGMHKGPHGMNATVGQAAQAARRMKREKVDEQRTAYEFQHDEEWNAMLRTLPSTCQLWRRFREFDQARRAYNAAQTARHAQRRELIDIAQRIDVAARDITAADDAWMGLEARSRRLELALNDLHGILAEAKTNLQRAEEAWGKTWQAYLQNEEKSRDTSGDRTTGAATARAGDLWRRN
jgi:chromosome segregation ATPase